MSVRISCSLLLLAGVMLAGCVQAEKPSRPMSGFQHAFAHSDCAPWDGSAWRIVLQNKPVVLPVPKPKPDWQHQTLPPVAYPHYEISLYTNQLEIGHWLEFPEYGEMKEGGGVITYCPAANQCKSQPGRVKITGFTEQAISGELRLHLNDKTGREQVLPFSAPRVPFMALCG